MPYLRYFAILSVLGITISAEALIYQHLTKPDPKERYQCFEQWPRASSWCQHVRAS